MPSQQVIQWVNALIGLTVVAAMAMLMMRQMTAAEPKEVGRLPQTIPDAKQQELVRQYGYWAVQTAEKVCPLGDAECVEREARRLYRSRILRR